MAVIESVSVAIDQGFGSAADPSSPAASSMGIVPIFAVLAVVSAAVLLVYLRALGRSR